MPFCQNEHTYRELISRVSQRALKYGISDKEVGNPNDDSVNGHLLSSTEKKQRAALIAQIKEKGYEQVMEEVAYTWFNRFSALRFMEVNGYLPTRVRVFTEENNAFKPQILTEAERGSLSMKWSCNSLKSIGRISEEREVEC